MKVFEFSQPMEYLGSVLQEKQARNPRFSLRAWSRQLGFKSPSMLSAVLKGQRKLKPALATRIALTLELTPLERRYLEVMSLADNSRSDHEKQIHLDILETLRPRQESHELDLDHFRFIADWYHLAILEMVSLPDFDEDSEAIAQRLGGTLAPMLARAAIDRLLRLELLSRNENGRLVRTPSRVKTGDSIPSSAVRSHHLQMIKKAEAALQNQPMEERDFRGTTLPLRKKDLPQLKKLVGEFHKKVQALSSDQGDEVYRVNSQAFSLTRKDVP